MCTCVYIYIYTYIYMYMYTHRKIFDTSIRYLTIEFTNPEKIMSPS